MACRDFISEASRRGIIVEITLFSSHYQEQHWKLSPFNPANNTNGTDAIDWKKLHTLENGAIRNFQISPEDVGLPTVKPEILRGADAAANAKAVEDVLEGKKTPLRDVALLNAAAALVVAGKAKDLRAGFALAARSIDSGEAEGRLDRLIVVSNDG